MLTQNGMLIKHMKRRSITPLEALKRYGIMRLASRINDIKAMGHKVQSEMVKNDITGKRYKKYWI